MFPTSLGAHHALLPGLGQIDIQETIAHMLVLPPQSLLTSVIQRASLKAHLHGRQWAHDETVDAHGSEHSACTGVAYTFNHTTSLLTWQQPCGKAIGRVRPLAGSFMHALGASLGIEFSTSNPLWTWAKRHAAWVINRYSVTAGRGITSFELLNGKPYSGKRCQFDEPVFGFQMSHSKGNPRWRRMAFLGKTDPQDSYLLQNGFNPPVVDVEPSKFYDEDAEAVRQKALEEQREDYETASMAIHDKENLLQENEQQPQGASVAQHPEPTGIFDDPVEGGDGQLQETTVSGGANPALGLPGPTTSLSYILRGTENSSSCSSF